MKQKGKFPTNFLTFAAREFLLRILRRRGCFWTSLSQHFASFLLVLSCFLSAQFSAATFPEHVASIVLIGKKAPPRQLACTCQNHNIDSARMIARLFSAVGPTAGRLKSGSKKCHTVKNAGVENAFSTTACSTPTFSAPPDCTERFPGAFRYRNVSHRCIFRRL